MLKLVREKGRIISLIIAVIIVFSSWTIYYRLPFTWFFYLILLFWIFTHFKYNPQKFGLFIIFLVLSLWYYRPADFSFSGGGFVKSFLISSLFLLDHKHQKQILEAIKDILFILVLIGVLFHISGIVAGLRLPEITTVYIDDRYYHVYPLIVYQYGLESIRFASIFDEPGYLGTIIGLLLLLEGFNLNNFKNIVLFIGGVFTLSLAFYIFAALGFVTSSIYKKNFKTLLFSVIAVVVVILVLSYYFPDVLEFFLNRKEFNSLGGGEFEDSRGGIEAFNENIKIISSRPFLNQLFGNGFDAPLLLFKYNTVSIASSSIYRLIFQIGFLGVIYLILFILINVEKKYVPIVFALAFILSLYQRPQIFEPMYIIMLAFVMKSSSRVKHLSA